MTHYQSESDLVEAIDLEIGRCTWEPHPKYSVFTQYDKAYYLARRSEFIDKYRAFFSIAKALQPSSIIELGTLAGSSADAFLSGAPNTGYTGLDSFCPYAFPDGSHWAPREIAEHLLRARGFQRWELMQVDIRQLVALPHPAELVFIDAASDCGNVLADLNLSLSADPDYILVDDTDGESGPGLALCSFLQRNAPGIDFACKVGYIGGGLLLKLRRFNGAVFNGTRGLWLRESNSIDRAIVTDVLNKNRYRLPDKLIDSDVVIDVGAHVGSFSYTCLERGAGKVYSFEPDEDNFRICQKNLRHFDGRSVLSKAAVWRSDTSAKELKFTGPARTLDGLNYGGGNMIFQDGDQIITSLDTLDSVLSGLRHVRLLKLDCEGSEWPILLTSRLLDVVQEIVGEFHELGGEGQPLIPDPAKVTGYSVYNAETLVKFLGRHEFATEIVKEANSSIGTFFAKRM